MVHSMTRSVYVNGFWKKEHEATVSVFDRGFIFGDAVYEVTCVLQGKLVDYDNHATRLRRSLEQVAIDLPCSEEELLSLHRGAVQRNAMNEGLIYLQVTRGVADRDFGFPSPKVPASIVMFTQEKNVSNNPLFEAGIAVITVPDERWARRDIKSVQLLAPVLARAKAVAAGAFDAWMVEDGFITEATASTAFIVTQDREIVTRGLSSAILPGVTRRAIIELAKQEGLNVVQRPFSVDEVKEAAEAFTTGSIDFVTPVVSIDGMSVGTGRPGPMARQLSKLYIRMTADSSI